MRLSRVLVTFPSQTRKLAMFRALCLTLLCIILLGSGAAFTPARASHRPPSNPSSAVAPAVTGFDLTLRASQYRDERSEATETSLKDRLVLPAGVSEITFTSDPTEAPIHFSDVAPHWKADSPEGTSIRVELRTSSDGQRWDDWQFSDVEDIFVPDDPSDETFANIISVGQGERTHRFVQSRITLYSEKPGFSPVFHSLTYTFINSGVTANLPRPQVMAQGTPSDVPKPLLVSRKDWGSPQGSSSPRWTPKYRRVTHMVIHNTATPNNDTDFAARVRAIWYYHANTRGWGDIGYNYVIDPNGVVYEGRAGGDDVEAGHAYPFNIGTTGIGLLGNFQTVAPSASAQASLIDLLSWKASQRGIDPKAVEPITGYTNCGTKITLERPTIAGHRDFRGVACGKPYNKTTCPGDKLWSMLPQIRDAVVSDQPPLRSLFLAHDTPGNLQPGAEVTVRLTVRNTGSLTWAAKGQGAVTLGYQWLTTDGGRLKSGWKDVKTTLSKDVSFADTITITAKLHAPTSTGHYVLMWDMFRDGEGWFDQNGSRALRVDVVVGKTVGDKASPKSSILPLPIYSSSPEIFVRWAGEDDPGGSGIASYDVQYRIAPSGAWTDWQSATSETQVTLEGQDGYTYEFRSRSRDAAGNVEVWPQQAQGYTTVDTRPPAVSVEAPLNGAHVAPGPLLIRGQTEPGTFVAINDNRAEEAGGVFTSTVQAAGRDFIIHITASDPAGNISRLDVKVQAAAKYNDVPLLHPAFLAVESLSDEKVISGYNDGTFRPDAKITRAQLAKVLANAFRWGLISPQEGRFTDVPADSWMFSYVETAAARGVFRGSMEENFRPTATVPKAEVTYAVVRAAGWPILERNAGSFFDVPRGHWAASYIHTADSRGIIFPDDEGYFYPNSSASRADVASILYETVKKLRANEDPTTRDDQGNQDENPIGQP